MKKLISILITAFIVVGLTGCSNSPLDPKNPVTVTLWHYYHGVQQTALDEMIKEFNTTVGLKKGVLVESFSYGGVNELSENVFASANGEAGTLPMPDLFSSYSDSAYELSKMDILVDLDKYFTPEEQDKYISGFLDDGRFADGALRVLPVAKSTEIFMLNKTDWDIFEKDINKVLADIDKISLEMLQTWEGLVKISELYYNWTDAQTDEPNDGKAFFGIDSAANYIHTAAKQLGIELVDAKTEMLNLDETVLRKLWDTYYVSAVKGYFGSYGRFRSDDVKTGDMLCFVGSSASAAYFPLAVTPEDISEYSIESYVSSYPVFEKSKAYVIQQGAGMCISKSDEKHEYAAAEFLKWFTAPEQNIVFAINSAGYLPVTTEAMNKMNENEEYSALENSDSGAERILHKVLETTIKQQDIYDYYSASVFVGTSKFRSNLDTLKSAAAADRAALLEAVNSGADYGAELQKLITDDAFKTWVNEIGKI